MGTTTVSYQQTYQGLPVWQAGVSITIQPEPMRVTASQSSVHKGLSLPVEDGAAAGPTTISVDAVKNLLGVGPGAALTMNSTRRLIYCYDPTQRIDPESQTAPGAPGLQSGPPTLPLPPVAENIVPGQHYVVSEVLFALPVDKYGPVNWRAFVETARGSVLYLRAFVACATGMVFRSDPATAGAAPIVTPSAAAAVLNPFRSTVSLAGLAMANPQPLSGAFVQLVENDAPNVPPPTRANPPANFFYDAPSREFAAVNAYHHCDWLFRLMQGMGFNVPGYFDGTSFPVPVDASAFGDALNARAPGNTTGTGSGGFQFGLAGTAPAVSIAADLRVVLHEFGHALLWDNVHSPNFGFAHSAGDSLAAILLDPDSALRGNAVRRFETFPWVLPLRNHGRTVASGWGWGGANDVGSYSSEQILSTTHFRLYRSLGGDSTSAIRRRMAARQAAYLIFRAIGSLGSAPITPTPEPDIFATALMNADIGTSNFEGQRGGAFHKVVRWSFEKQGLYQLPAAPTPVTTEGAPPPVDVYIDDGRHGQYPWQPVHWECRDIWNRRTAGAGPHQTPVVGRTNYAYVRVKNRGRQHAHNVTVRGYSANPCAGLTWPGDFTPFVTAQIAVPGGIAPGATVVVGPFRWKPRVVGHECMLAHVSADGDFSNLDARTFFPCATGPTPEWRVVPFDNNIGQRNVAPVPGGGGRRGLISGFLGRTFLVRNPFERPASTTMKIEVPSFLRERDWQVLVNQNAQEATFGLAPGSEKTIEVSLKPGREFTPAELRAAGGGVAIRVIAVADGTPIGGMTYELDPTLKVAPSEQIGEPPLSLNDPRILAIIQDSQIDDQAGDGAEAAPADEGEGEGEDAPTEPESGEPDASFGAAGRLLADLGVRSKIAGKVTRVTVRRIGLDIDVEDN